MNHEHRQEKKTKSQWTGGCANKKDDQSEALDE